MWDNACQSQQISPLQVELKVHSIRCVSRAEALPFELADAMRSEEELQREDAQFATVTQDIRLDNRWIDLRTAANQAIFQLESEVIQVCNPCLEQVCMTSACAVPHADHLS